uniref:Uncharacterized protein n=1 Tax=Anguilla anguilla TaxID=7936 RepID=A0A0E9Q2W7_ANGAN
MTMQYECYALTLVLVFHFHRDKCTLFISL